MSKLTDEQIEQISQQIERSDFFDCVIPFARAIESAATEPLLQRIAELEEMNAQLREQNAEVDKACAELEAANEAFAQRQEWWNERMVELEEARKDAERYRWIRKQHWSENILGVVVRPKDQTKLGSMLPSMELLDDTIDHMSSEGTAMQKGQS